MSLEWFISHIGMVVYRRLADGNWREYTIKNQSEAEYHYHLSLKNIEYGEHRL